MREPRRSTWDGAPRRPPARDEWSTGEDRCEHASPCSWRLGVAACSDRSKAGRRAETGENEDEAQDPVARRRTWRLPAAARLPGSTSCIIRIDFRHRTRCRNAQQAPLHRPAFLRACASRSRFLRARVENRATPPSADAVSRGDRHLASRAAQPWTPSQWSACSRRHLARVGWHEGLSNPRGRRRLLSIVGETVYNRWPRLDTKPKWGAPQGRLFVLDKAQALPDPGGAPRRVA